MNLAGLRQSMERQRGSILVQHAVRMRSANERLAAAKAKKQEVQAKNREKSEKSVQTGARGGRFYLSFSGEKIYVR